MCSRWRFIFFVTVFSAFQISVLGGANAQTKQPIVAAANYNDPIISKVFPTAGEYRAFQEELAKLANARQISVILITVPDLKSGESIARIFAHARDEALKKMARANVALEKDRVLVVALSGDPMLFAVFPSNAIADLLTLRGTVYSEDFRRLQILMQTEPEESLTSLVPILYEDLRPPPQYLDYLTIFPAGFLTSELENRSEFGGVDSALEKFANWVFLIAQWIALQIEHTGFSGFWTLAVFVLVVGIVGLIGSFASDFLVPAHIDETQARAFSAGFELILEKIFAVGFAKLLITAVYGDLLSILKVSQIAHSEFFGLWQVTQLGHDLTPVNLSAAVRVLPTIVIFFYLVAMPIYYVGVIVVAAARHVSGEKLVVQSGRLLRALSQFHFSDMWADTKSIFREARLLAFVFLLPVSAVFLLVVIVSLIAVIPGLFALEGVFGTVVVGTLTIWALWQPLKPKAAALLKRLWNRFYHGVRPAPPRGRHDPFE